MMSLAQMANVLMTRASRPWHTLKEFYVARVADTMDFHARRVEGIRVIHAYEDDELFTSREYYTSTSCSSRKS
uniref:Uncharacterized protein n=1 Tax=Anopheles dirus TaxID=7168 RepID=A0A182N2E5_9DIPT